MQESASATAGEQAKQCRSRQPGHAGLGDDCADLEVVGPQPSAASGIIATGADRGIREVRVDAAGKRRQVNDAPRYFVYVNFDLLISLIEAYGIVMPGIRTSDPRVEVGDWSIGGPIVKLDPTAASAKEDRERASAANRARQRTRSDVNSVT